MAMDRSLVRDRNTDLSVAMVFRATDNYYHFFESGCWWESCSITLIHTTWWLPFKKGRNLGSIKAFCLIVKSMDYGKGDIQKKFWEERFVRAWPVWSADEPIVDGLIRRSLGDRSTKLKGKFRSTDNSEVDEVNSREAWLKNLADWWSDYSWFGLASLKKKNLTRKGL